MKELLDNSKIDSTGLKSFIIKSVAQEIMNLSEPCYYPALKKHVNDFFYYTKLNEKDIIPYFKKFYKQTPAPDAELKKDVMSNLLIFIMYYFLQKKDKHGFENTMNYYMIRQYSNLMHKQIQYCNPEVFKYTLDNLSKNHLYLREGTISSAIIHIAKEMIRRYQSTIKMGDPFAIAKFINESRTRLSQSVKSFAELYYKFGKEGIKITSTEKIGKDDEEYTIEIMEKGKRIAGDVTNHISIYKNINVIAINDAKKITRINQTLAYNMAKQLIDSKYNNQIRLVIELFLKDLTSVNQICGPGFLIYVKNLMSLKRTTQQIYFKQEVINLTEQVIEDIDYLEKYQKVTPQTRFLIACFTAYYLTIVTRHLVCGKIELKIGSFRIY